MPNQHLSNPGGAWGAGGALCGGLGEGAACGGGPGQLAEAVPSLLDLCMRCLMDRLSRRSGSGYEVGEAGLPPACHVAQVAELLLPTTRSLYRCGRLRGQHARVKPQCYDFLVWVCVACDLATSQAACLSMSVSSTQQRLGCVLDGRSGLLLPVPACTHGA